MSEQYLIKDNFETISNNPPAPPVALCKFCGEIVKWGVHGYFCTCHGAQLYNELQHFIAKTGAPRIKKQKLIMKKIELYREISDIEREIEYEETSRVCK